MLEGHTCCKCR